MAMSLDGRTALANSESRWITGEAARRDVHHWRARSSAVMTGVATVLADDPALTVRLAASSWERQGCTGAIRQPLRVVLDSRLRTPVGARILKQPGETWFFAAVGQAAPAAAALESAGGRVEYVATRPDGAGLDLTAVMQRLAQLGANEVWLEAGPTLSGALLKANLVDELILYVAPVIMGDRARGLFALPAITRMVDCMRLEIVDVRAVGDDWRIIARPAQSSDAA